MVMQSIKMALHAIYASKMRSFLTMLGIIIGVFSLVVLVSIIDGTTGFVTNAFSAMGNNNINVIISDDKGKPIEDEDLEEIVGFEEFSNVAPTLSGTAKIIANGREKTVNISAVTPAYFQIINRRPMYGRLISSVDEENHSNVIVLNYITAEYLFGTADCIGETVKLDGYDYKVVGVLAKDTGFIGLILGGEYTVYIPFSEYNRHAGVTFNGYSSFQLQVSSEELGDQANTRINEYLSERFNDDTDAYVANSQAEALDTLGNITTVLSIVFGGIAAISLLVGGIGIMNIMLVSVTERTREIGIRKAIGASKGAIMLQFLIEAFVISVTGCILGILLAYLVIQLANVILNAMDLEIIFRLPLNVIVLSFGFALMVGLVFGLYPANKAASKKPIDALRYNG